MNCLGTRLGHSHYQCWQSLHNQPTKLCKGWSSQGLWLITHQVATFSPRCWLCANWQEQPHLQASDRAAYISEWDCGQGLVPIPGTRTETHTPAHVGHCSVRRGQSTRSAPLGGTWRACFPKVCFQDIPTPSGLCTTVVCPFPFLTSYQVSVSSPPRSLLS